MNTYDTCTACGQRPVCKLAEATIIVTARDYRGVITGLCRACGGGEDDEDETHNVSVDATHPATSGEQAAVQPLPSPKKRPQRGK